MAIEIDNDNDEIRIDGYEYAASKVNVKTYSISSEVSQAGNSADLRITDSDGYIDSVTFSGGSNVSIVRTNGNTITISSGDVDTNTTYSISAETSLIPNSAILRLSGSDGYTDDVVFVGGTSMQIVRTDASTLTVNSLQNSFSSFTDGYSTAVADQTSDTFGIISGPGINATINASNDSLTIANTGVTSLNSSTGAQYTYSTFTDGTTPTTAGPGNTTMTLTGSNGISVTTSPNTATISMSQVSIVRGTDTTIGFGATTSVLTTNVLPINTTVEIQGVILLAFSNAAAANTYTVSLTTSSGTIGANTSKAGLGFAAHAGPSAGSPGETTKQAPSFTYPQQITNTNDHTIRFSGIFQTDGTTPNSLVINVRNNCANAGENLVVYAKSFLKYNVI
jgi:hypothetical protein